MGELVFDFHGISQTARLEYAGNSPRTAAVNLEGSIARPDSGIDHPAPLIDGST